MDRDLVLQELAKASAYEVYRLRWALDEATGNAAPEP